MQWQVGGAGQSQQRWYDIGSSNSSSSSHVVASGDALGVLEAPGVCDVCPSPRLRPEYSMGGVYTCEQFRILGNQASICRAPNRFQSARSICEGYGEKESHCHTAHRMLKLVCGELEE